MAREPGRQGDLGQHLRATEQLLLGVGFQCAAWRGRLLGLGLGFPCGTGEPYEINVVVKFTIFMNVLPVHQKKGGLTVLLLV